MPRQPVVRMLGTRGVPAAHGGFETAVDNISRHLVTHGWRVVVYCQVAGVPGRRLGGPVTEDVWRGVERVLVPALGDGVASTVRFDVRATRHAARERDLCVTFGYNTALLNVWQRLHRQPLLFNMDGIEWKRERWGPAKRAAFYAQERVACRIADHLIADHPVIADHLATRTRRDRISTIAYGAPVITEAPVGPVEDVGLTPGGFSTVICRPVAENNLLEIVTAFSRRRRDHVLVVLGDLDPADPYHARVRDAAGPEVLLAGAVYDPTAIGALRFHSRLYVHGHTVGGTNPSLVEALGAGNPVLAHDNPYNRWVAGPEQRYFRTADDLADHLDALLDDPDGLARMGRAARDRHAAEFTWDVVAGQYEQLLRRFVP